MGLFSDIISGIGNGVSDIFGGGGGDDNNNKRKQPQAPTIAAPQNNQSSVKLPAVLQMAKGPTQLQPIHPVNIGGAPQPANPLAAPQSPAAPAQINTTSYSAPHTSLFGHLLNAAKDTGEVVASAVPEVGLGATRVATGLVQGATQIPHLATSLVSTGTKALADTGLPGAGTVNRVAQDVNTGTKDATNFVDKPINAASRGIDTVAKDYSNVGPLAGMGEQDYKDTQIPLNVLAGLLTLGGGTAAEGAGEAGEAGQGGGIVSKISDFLNKPVIGSADDAISKVAGGVQNAVKPVVDALNAPISSGIKAIKSVIPGGEVTDEVASADKTPVESGTKAPAEPSNAPAGDKTAPPAPADGASETGVKPPAEPVENPAAAATPGATEPTLNETGNAHQDLLNTLGLTQDRLDNARDFAPDNNKNMVQKVLDTANHHFGANGTIAKTLNKRMGSGLTDTSASNVIHAIETGNAKGLSTKEKAVHDALQGIEGSSKTLRTAENPNFEAADHHFPQVRQASVRGAIKGAIRGKNKVSTFNDLLNQDSRFSEKSSLGTFTRKGGKTLTGDAHDLGLTLKKGQYVDKAGRPYEYSRATSRDLTKAGVKLQAPKDALTTYVRDTLNIKTRADARDYLVKNSDDLGLSHDPVPGKTTPVVLKDATGKEDTLYTDKGTASDIQKSGILGNIHGSQNLGVKAWNALNSVVTQGIVANPTVDSINRVANGFIGSGIRRNGIANPGFLKGVLSGIDDAKMLRMQESGTYFPTFGKDSENIVSKATGGLSKLNEKTISAVDAHVRSSMFDKLTAGGMTDKQASQQINRVLGGHGTYNKDTAQLGMFWKYFGRQVKNAGQLFTNAAKGHPGELINAAVIAAGTYGADKGLQAATGNKGAYVHAPGIVGIGEDAVKDAGEIKSGNDRELATTNPVISHLTPVIPTAFQDIYGVNAFGDKLQPGVGPVVKNTEGITPETNILNNNGHSTAEKLLNTFGIYTPHVAGDMAVSSKTPGASVLNVKNAQNGGTNSVAFPKDFTGEQEANVANKLGGNYTTKSAALLGTKSQPQQVKYIDAVNTLNKYGITDSADAQSFSKLNSKDQGSYVKAVDALNTAGTTFSSDTLQTQLVKQGDTALAASLNSDISPKLDQGDKNVLEQYYTMTSSSGNVTPASEEWLQDPTNATNYFGALINQAKATNTLTAEDQNVGATYDGSLDLGDSSNSLYTKYLVSQVNKQNNVPSSTQALYADTSYDDFKDLAAGPQLTALTTYAEQLAAAGVPNKYFIGSNGGSTSGSSSSSSSGSSPYDADVAAGIPDGTIAESFVKPTSDSGLKSVNAVAFKGPKLVKYAPDTKSNPYTRTISVKSGVH